MIAEAEIGKKKGEHHPRFRHHTELAVDGPEEQRLHPEGTLASVCTAQESDAAQT